MAFDLKVAARTLALDLATGEVVRAFEAASIDCLVLKGPAMVHRLYGDAPERRNYGDIDLAVGPMQFDHAGQVLATLGFCDVMAGIRSSEAARLEERSWHRDGSAYVAVDLHRGFHEVTDRSAWWEVLALHREVLVVEGQPVNIPDRVGCAVIAALHASRATSLHKPLEDLRRALQCFDDEEWSQAARLAGSVGAGDAFTAALCRLDQGSRLASRLGLAVTDPLVWFRATSVERGIGSLSLVLEPGTWPVRARRLWDVAFPSRTILADTRPIARRGPIGLAMARLGRLGLIVGHLPQLLVARRRSLQAMPRRNPVVR